VSVEQLVECSFFIPIRRDASFSDGMAQGKKDWRWLSAQLTARFGSWTTAPGLYQGVWTNPDTGQLVSDLSKKYLVALSRGDIPRLRTFLRRVCKRFGQQCLYLSIAGIVEFVENKP
jgi:hypothetical protein